MRGPPLSGAPLFGGAVPPSLRTVTRPHGHTSPWASHDLPGQVPSLARAPPRGTPKGRGLGLWALQPPRVLELLHGVGLFPKSPIRFDRLRPYFSGCLPATLFTPTCNPMCPGRSSSTRCTPRSRRRPPCAHSSALGGCWRGAPRRASGWRWACWPCRAVCSAPRPDHTPTKHSAGLLRACYPRVIPPRFVLGTLSVDTAPFATHGTT